MRGVKPIENRTVKKCPFCGSEFLAFKDNHIYCSKKCVLANWHGENRRDKIEKCKYCGKNFIVSRFCRVYCSKECSTKAEVLRKKVVGGPGKGHSPKRIPIIHEPNKICDMCGKAFFKQLCYVRRDHVKHFCSNTCRTTYRSNDVDTYPNTSRRSRVGKRQDLGIFVRSAWEANYARYLNWLIGLGEIKKWEYEVDTFQFENIKRGTRFYTPDFKITNNDGSIEYHEVKGYMDDKSKTKIRRFNKYYPNIKLVIIDKEFYEPLSRQMKNLIPNWETYSKSY